MKNKVIKHCKVCNKKWTQKDWPKIEQKIVVWEDFGLIHFNCSCNTSLSFMYLTNLHNEAKNEAYMCKKVRSSG